MYCLKFKPNTSKHALKVHIALNKKTQPFRIQGSAASYSRPPNAAKMAVATWGLRWWPPLQWHRVGRFPARRVMSRSLATCWVKIANWHSLGSLNESHEEWNFCSPGASLGEYGACSWDWMAPSQGQTALPPSRAPPPPLESNHWRKAKKQRRKVSSCWTHSIERSMIHGAAKLPLLLTANDLDALRKLLVRDMPWHHDHHPGLVWQADQSP